MYKNINLEHAHISKTIGEHDKAQIPKKIIVGETLYGYILLRDIAQCGEKIYIKFEDCIPNMSSDMGIFNTSPVNWQWVCLLSMPDVPSKTWTTALLPLISKTCNTIREITIYLYGRYLDEN